MVPSAVRDIIHRLSSFGHSIPTSVLPIGRGPIRIGHQEAVASGVDSSSVNSGALRWYFAHASVGSNILDGLRDLRTSNPAVFPYSTVAALPKAPMQTKPGTIYDHDRGNPGWKAKIDQFSSSVQSGWHFPVVDVVLNKLCYIDQFASPNYYLKSMARLETAFPETLFVYATMPLTTATDWKNEYRGRFNNLVRDWTQANGRVLFDIADIEAHGPAGNACTFTRGKGLSHRLCPEYSDDGGHLNALGRRILAQGFYALAAAVSKVCLAERGKAGPSEQKLADAA